MEITRIKEKKSLHTFKDSTSPTILLRINTKAKRITLHIGTLPYDQRQNVVELLKNKVKLIY